MNYQISEAEYRSLELLRGNGAQVPDAGAMLLIDADVSRPSVLNILGLPPKKGLMDVLTSNDMQLGDVLLKTNIEKLSLLPAGTPHPGMMQPPSRRAIARRW